MQDLNESFYQKQVYEARMFLLNLHHGNVPILPFAALVETAVFCDSNNNDSTLS